MKFLFVIQKVVVHIIIVMHDGTRKRWLTRTRDFLFRNRPVPVDWPIIEYLGGWGMGIAMVLLSNGCKGMDAGVGSPGIMGNVFDTIPYYQLMFACVRNSHLFILENRSIYLSLIILVLK